MHPDPKISLCKVRLQHAEQCLKSAESLLNESDYKGAANRSYYAIFHALRAVLAFDDFDSNKHSGIISTFNKLYVKTGIFSKETSQLISSAFDVRTDSDYNDFFTISRESVTQQITDASYLIQSIKNYLCQKYNL
ncbi:MAG: HEPN domain protein [bacterium ADurb.Bin157]|nr:MAG: HEPN domain protein [bacterium ADurb.Bin157]